MQCIIHPCVHILPWHARGLPRCMQACSWICKKCPIDEMHMHMMPSLTSADHAVLCAACQAAQRNFSPSVLDVADDRRGAARAHRWRAQHGHAGATPRRRLRLMRGRASPERSVPPLQSLHACSGTRGALVEPCGAGGVGVGIYLFYFIVVSAIANTNQNFLLL